MKYSDQGKNMKTAGGGAAEDIQPIRKNLGGLIGYDQIKAVVKDPLGSVRALAKDPLSPLSGLGLNPDLFNKKRDRKKAEKKVEETGN